MFSMVPIKIVTEKYQWVPLHCRIRLIIIIIIIIIIIRAQGGAVGWGTALQTGRLRFWFPMVSMELLFEIILLVHYGPGVDSASNRNEYQEYILGVKAAGAFFWQPYHLHVPIVLKSGNLNLLEPSGPVRACNGITFTVLH